MIPTPDAERYEPGKLTASWTVVEELLTPEFGKSDIIVLASPALIALVEISCIRLLERDLSADETSVGARVDFVHMRPSYEGDVVHVEASMERPKKRKATFSVVVRGDHGQTLAECAHVRGIVELAQFRDHAGGER